VKRSLLIWLVLGFLTGFAAGGLPGSQSVSDPPDEAKPPTVNTPNSDWTGERNARSDDFASLEDCESKRALVREQSAAKISGLKSELSVLRGESYQWPADLSQEFTPDSVARLIDETRRECPANTGTRYFHDCSEFPCLVWVRTVGDIDAPNRTDCPALPFRTFSYSLISGNPMENPDEAVSMTILQASPEGWQHAGNWNEVNKRLLYRHKVLRSVVIEDWAAEAEEE